MSFDLRLESLFIELCTLSIPILRDLCSDPCCIRSRRHDNLCLVYLHVMALPP